MNTRTLKRLKTKLEVYIQHRQRLAAKRDEFDAKLRETNGEILGLLEKIGKSRVFFKGLGTIMKVQPQKISYKDKVIEKWYKKKGLKPPFKMVKTLDLEQLALDIKEKRVPAKMLKKFTEVETLTAYSRFDKDPNA